jgi:hypothetical protein
MIPAIVENFGLPNWLMLSPVSHAHLRQPIACKIETSKTEALWEILTLTSQTQISLSTHMSQLNIFSQM